MNRIQKLFQIRNEKIIIYLTAGYPNKKDTINMVLAAESAGAAMIELGIPFSDPLADGPIIQESSQKAINNGVTIKWILETIARIRNESDIPIAVMGYINPIIKYGIKNFINACVSSGVDGLIIPDLPFEESREFATEANIRNISPILLVAPNTPAKRINAISKLAGDLIYCVALLGITGSAGAKKDKLESYLKRVEQNSECPFVVGFGIKERVDVINVNKIAHGAVIGSAIIKEMNNSVDPSKLIVSYINQLKG